MGISRVLPCISDDDMVALCYLDQVKSVNQKVETTDEKTYERLFDLGYAVKDDRLGFGSITTLGISYIEGELHEEADSKVNAWKSFAPFASSMAALFMSFCSVLIAASARDVPFCIIPLAAVVLLIVLGFMEFKRRQYSKNAKAIRDNGRFKFEQDFINNHEKS